MMELSDNFNLSVKCKICFFLNRGLLGGKNEKGGGDTPPPLIVFLLHVF